MEFSDSSLPFKVGMLVPMTSRGRDWKSLEDSYFLNHSFPTVIKSNRRDSMLNMIDIHWYLAVDEGDLIYSKENLLKSVVNEKPDHLHIFSWPMEVSGNICELWNRLFKEAFKDGCSYFYQMGDDIYFYPSCSFNWIMSSIECLQMHSNIGVTGPVSHRTVLKLTQCFVHRNHGLIFGMNFFPSGYRNYGVDEWSNYVYQPHHFYWLKNKKYYNCSGLPRYDNTLYVNHFSNWELRTMMGRMQLQEFLVKYPEMICVGKTNIQKHLGYFSPVSHGDQQHLLLGFHWNLQEYPKERIRFMDHRINDYSSLRSFRKLLITYQVPQDSIIVIFDEWTCYSPKRLRHIADIISDGKIRDSGGVQRVTFRNIDRNFFHSGKRKDDKGYDDVHIHFPHQNECFWESRAFLAKFLWNHKVLFDHSSQGDHYERSMFEHLDYPMTIFDPKSCVEFILQDGKNGKDSFSLAMTLEKDA